MFIVYILIFIVFLSVLIVVHELGHLLAAKTFNVYCNEFSIGFGPALLHKKRKNGETYFSVRAVPLGGYVSMFGEGVELEPGVEVSQERSLEGIKKWKRAIILVAGVSMNAVLALIIFFTCAFIPSTKYSPNSFNVSENSLAEVAGFKTGDFVGYQAINDSVIIVDASPVIIRDAKVYTTDTVAVFNLNNFTSFQELDVSQFLEFYECEKNEDGVVTTVYFGKQIAPDEHFDSAVVTFKIYEDKTYETVRGNFPIDVSKQENGKLASFGLSFPSFDVREANSFTEGVNVMFNDFGQSSVLIFKTLGTLFTKETASNLGGIVAIGFETTNILQNYGFSYFFNMWGIISVNLAIVNLIPFPGLDGWQLLVLLVEAIAHKKIPEKAKNIVSFVGIAILFVLMILLVVKDVFTYIF